MGTGDTQTRAAEPATGRRWTFGPAVLDERSLELTVGGAPAHLERKPLEVLLYLLHHAGEVVTKEELAETVWPGRILTESVLTRCMSQLRQALKDDNRALVRTVHGFGYRLVAEVRVDAAPTRASPVFTFKSGDHPPLRPQWRLIERLGTGGHGEAWLARHEKTQDARVFKFALDAQALVSLKREITLYRLLHDSLGERAAVAQVLEWNLEEPPYFIETEFIEGRDLRAWADSRGGIVGVPLERRLDLVAQIAEALATAHSVGVLHKDLKPGNVLVRGGPDAPTVRLCDFGSGGVLDAARLDALGITNLGFTRTAADHGSGGTPLYLAPEIVAGQPFTVAADVYALGVMLYQLVVADLRRPLAPGWELNVEDELLREDIAAAAAGDPARRLADAAQLAARLRSLESRRQARAAEQAARERVERTQRIMRELRRTRAFAFTVLLLAVAALAGGVAAYRARNEAIAARATTQAINEFLTDGVLSVDPAAERPKDASYESLLNRAATQVDLRFKDQPEAAASIHWLLGRRFQEVSHLDPAKVQYEKAATLLPELRGRTALPALLSMDRLIPIYFDGGRRAEAVAISEKLLSHWTERYGKTNLSTYLLRERLARLLAYAGELRRAEAELLSILADVPAATPLSEETRFVLNEWLGVVLAADTSGLTTHKQIVELATAHIKSTHGGYLIDFAEDYTQGEARYREAHAVFSKTFGNDNEMVAVTRLGRAGALTGLGRYEEAQVEMLHASEFFESSLPPLHWLHAIPKLFSGRIALEQGQPERAVATLEAATTSCVKGGCSPRIAEDIRYDLGRAYDKLGNLQRATDIYRGSLRTYELLRGPNDIGCLRRRVSLADALRRSRNPLDASAVLIGVTPEALEALSPRHLVIAEVRRVQGLLWLEDRQWAKAQETLNESLRIVEQRLGPKHWRTERARLELAQAARH